MEQWKDAEVERREREWEGEWESWSIGLPARATREKRRGGREVGRREGEGGVCAVVGVKTQIDHQPGCYIGGG